MHGADVDGLVVDLQRVLEVLQDGQRRLAGGMQECVRRARDARAEALTLHTVPAMRAAVRLYTRMGFQPAPDLDFQPAPGFTVNGYRLTLGPPIE